MYLLNLKVDFDKKLKRLKHRCFYRRKTAVFFVIINLQRIIVDNMERRGMTTGKTGVLWKLKN